MDSTATPAFFLFLLSIITIYHIGFGTALHIDVYPEKVNELIDNEVNITCHLGESTDGDGNVILVELGKEGEHPIAILRKAELNYGPDRKMNVKAEGRIVKDSTQSFLRLTISDPETGDAGTYSCSVFYTDVFGVMKESKVEARVTVDNDNHKVVLVHLLKKMSDLEKTAETQDKLLQQQEKELTDQQNSIKDLKKALRDQQDNTKDLEKQLKDQQDNTNVLENTVTQQKKELKDQQDSTKVLENTMAQQKKQLKNQQDNTSVLENTVAQQKKQLEDQQDKTNVLEQTVARQEKELEDQRTKETVTIAFSYAYNTSDELVKGQPMLFTDKIMSIGDAYDPKSGVFTAPRDGLYVFHLVVGTYDNNDQIEIYLEANGKYFAGLYVRDLNDDDQASVSSVTSLKAGDHVRPVLYSISTKGNKAWPGRISAFSGYLQKLL